MTKVIVFDLDDTLYKEIDFLKSGYSKVCDEIGLDILDEMLDLYHSKSNTFEKIIEKYNINFSIEVLINIYRKHSPQINLQTGVKEMLETLSTQYPLAIITDGFKETQKNKINALDIGHLFSKILISEETGYCKPSIKPYLMIEEFFGKSSYFYVADNPSKDFLAPNYLKWTTIQLFDDGRNIHKKTDGFPSNHLPQKVINNLDELLNIL